MYKTEWTWPKNKRIMTSASFGASGGKTGEMTGKSTRRDILYVVTHSIFFHYNEKNPPFWHHSCQSERTKINFKSVYKKNKIEIKKFIFLINRYAIAKKKILKNYEEIEKMSKIIIPITLIYWKKRKEIIMKRHTVIIHVMKV